VDIPDINQNIEPRPAPVVKLICGMGPQVKRFLHRYNDAITVKVVAFKGTIRKFKYTVVAAHIEGLRHPPVCLFKTLFCVSVPLIKKYMVNFNVINE
jgi:hypothetical protein